MRWARWASAWRSTRLAFDHLHWPQPRPCSRCLWPVGSPSWKTFSYATTARTSARVNVCLSNLLEILISFNQTLSINDVMQLGDGGTHICQTSHIRVRKGEKGYFGFKLPWCHSRSVLIPNVGSLIMSLNIKSAIFMVKLAKPWVDFIKIGARRKS